MRRSLGALLFSAASLIATSVLADTIDAQPATTNSLRAAITNAEIELRAAQALGNAWLDSEALIARAKSRARAGDLDGALALARLAREQSELGQNQAKLEHARYLLGEHGEHYASPVRTAAERLLRAYDGAGALRVLSKTRQ